MISKLIKNKKIVIIASILILILIAVPLTIIQVKTQQETRQRAAQMQPPELFNPSLKLVRTNGSTNSIAINETFPVELRLSNPKKFDIAAVAIDIKYNKNLLELTNDTLPEKFDEKITDNRDGIKYTLINTSANSIDDPDIVLGSFIFTGKTLGSTGISIASENIYASGNYKALDVDTIINSVFATVAQTPNPATLAFIDFIQGSFEEELTPLVPHKVSGFGGVLYSVTDFLNDLSLVYLSAKENRVADLTKQITVYTLIRNEVEIGKSLDDILKQYSELVDVSDGKTFFSEKGKSFIKQKYDNIIAAHDKECEQLRDKPAKKRGICFFYPYEGKGKDYKDSISDPVIQDIFNVKEDEIRLIKELGNPDAVLRALATYDRVTRNGNEGTNEGLEVYYQLAKRFDSNNEFGSAIEIYDAIAADSPSSEIGKLSKQRIEQLHSTGHQAKRVFYHIGASVADPTIIIPINMCGPGSVGCKLIGKLLLKPAVITKNIAKIGAEKTAQLLVKSFHITKEAADAVVDASSKLAKDEAGGINFWKMFGKAAKPIVKIFTEEERKSFQKDITDFLIPQEYGGAYLESFYVKFPQYKDYRLEDLAKIIPEYIDFSFGKSVKTPRINFSSRAFDKFLYRGEGSVIGVNLREKPKNILDLLAIYNKQGGIGRLESPTSLSPDIYFADKYVENPDGGIWIIKKTVMDELKAVLFDRRVETRIEGLVPLKYVEKLLVTKEMRQRILQEYGAESTELFGRPIKDVVIDAYDPNQIEPLIKTVLELNLESPK